MSSLALQEKVRARYHVQCHGASAAEANQTLVLAHGFGCDQQIWQALLPFLVADPLMAKYRVVTFDYAGCGRAAPELLGERSYRDLQHYAHDLQQVCQAFAPNEAIVLAHSISGAIAFLASLESPSFARKIIAIGPSACYLNHPETGYVGGFERQDIEGLLDMMERNYFDWAGYLAPQVMANSDRPEYSEALRSKFLATNPTHARRFAEVTFFIDIRDKLPQVATPVELLYCDNDIIVPTSAIYYIAEKLPHAHVHHVEGASGHYPHMSAPAAVAAIVQQLVAEH
ncbi:alpha/beta fold hydrolase [Aliidiomarina celeris]|uniref:alpha/beta fold hydrolase n=1 Tax=Aliidiomarina celeris TaxID=2249428 RepID=UPI000DE978E8|nr:alpha/beta hydrolase [Aliidiomarina celeris]